MSKLIEHAEQQLRACGAFDEADEGNLYGPALGNAVMELIRVHAAQNHSGMSDAIVRHLFNEMCKFNDLPKRGAK